MNIEQKMKIVLVGYLHGSGGAERQIILLANALSELGHNIYLFVLAAYNPCYKISDQVTVVDLTGEKKCFGTTILNRFLLYKKELARIKPNISIHYWLQSAYFTTLISRKLRGSIIYSERGDPYDREYSGILSIIRYLAFKKIDGFVFQSEGARDYFNTSIKNKSVVIHNPVSVPQGVYSVSKEREKRIISVGRLHPQKNQMLLIKAFAQIHTAIPEYTLEIYGDGPLKSQLEQQITELNLSNKVFLHKSRKDIFDCICNASLFVLTSDYEGMPNALMEAMALGLPCISTNCRPGGAQTLIQDGINGYIVPVGDIRSLAEKILFAITHPKEVQIIADKGRQIIDTHTPSRIFKQWAAFLRKLND